MTAAECDVRSRFDSPCDDGPQHAVIYTSLRTGAELDRSACCATHGAREVETHYAAGGIARVRVERVDGSSATAVGRADARVEPEPVDERPTELRELVQIGVEWALVMPDGRKISSDVDKPDAFVPDSSERAAKGEAAHYGEGWSVTSRPVYAAPWPE